MDDEEYGLFEKGIIRVSRERSKFEDFTVEESLREVLTGWVDGEGCSEG